MAAADSSRGRARPLLKVLGALVVLAVVLAVLNAVARSAAESLVATDVQKAAGLSSTPQVRVRGTFFLLQVLRGSYDEVDVTTTGLVSGPLRIDRVDSRLLHVQVPFHDVLVQDIRRVAIGRSEETATLSYADLNAYLEATGRGLVLASAGGDQVDVTGSLDVFGQTVQASGQVSLSVEDGSLQVVPRQVDTGNATLSDATRLLLGQRLTVAIPMDALPFGHELTAATASADGVQLQASGTNLLIQP